MSNFRRVILLGFVFSVFCGTSLSRAQVMPTVAINSPPRGTVGAVITLIPHTGTSTGAATFSLTNGTGTASLENDKLTLLTPGTVTVTLTVAADVNHLQATAQQEITIDKPRPEFGIVAASNGFVGGTIPLSVNAGGSSGTVTYSVTDDTGSATLSGTSLSLVSAGSVWVTASITGDATYGPASVTQLITINTADNQSPNMPQIWGTNSRGGTAGAGTIFRMNADGTGYQVVKEFSADELGSGTFYNATAVGPDGKLYGTTPSGGRYNAGVLYRFDPATSQYTVVHHFRKPTGTFPTSELCVGSDGKLYGTTQGGGVGDADVIFSFDPIASTYTKRADLDPNTIGSLSHGGIREASNGKMYGNTHKSFFEFDPSTNSATAKFEFSDALGRYPYAAPIQAPNGLIYGITSGYGAFSTGTIYEYDPVGNSVVVKVDLIPAEVGNPIATLTLAQNNKFYFTSSYGGGYGTILEYVPGATSATLKYTFTGGTSGNTPWSRMVAAPNGMLYGVTSAGGVFTQSGTIYQFDPANGQATVIYSFHHSTGGYAASGPTVLANGVIYGTTLTGGPDGAGVLYSFDPATNQYKMESTFKTSRGGITPSGSLVTSPSGAKLYGTALGGAGIAYEYDLTTRVFAIRARFGNLLGSEPRGFVRHGTKLFGNTRGGGEQSNGTVYEFNPETGAITVHANFGFNDGGSPGLYLASLGDNLYGSTTFGGNNNAGTVFTLTPSTDAISYVHMTGSTHGFQFQGFSVGPDGKLYGTSRSGGPNNVGTILQLDPSNSALTSVHNFAAADGSFPNSNPVVGPLGKMYGVTSQGGANSNGVLYEFDAQSGAYNARVNFTSAVSQLNLTKGVNGTLFGALNAGGANGKGGIFKFTPGPNNDYSVVVNFDETTGDTPIGEWLFVKAKQSITFAEREPVTLLQTSTVNLDATSSSGLTISYTSSDPSIASIAGNVLTIHKAGTITITALQPGDENFEPASSVNRQLVVNKAPQTITFAELSAKKFGDSFDVTATSTSTLNVTLSSDNTAVATVSAKNITAVGVGTVNITASQSGDDTYSAATPVVRTLTVGKADNVITFGELAPKTLGFTPFTLSASSSSSLPVVFSSTSDKITISGNTVTGVKPGRPTIKAEQAGNASYSAATTVERSFCINPPKPTIAMAQVGADAVLTSSNDAGNQWKLGGINVEGATAKTLTVTTEGSYTVVSTVDDCASEVSSAFVVIITGVELTESGLTAYPNPANGDLYVQANSHTDEIASFTIIDALGRTVAKQVGWTNREERISLENVSEGAYVIRAETSEGRFVRRFSRR